MKTSIVLIIIAGILCGAGVGAFFGLTHDLPQIRALESFRPPAVTRVYSQDKVLLAEIFAEHRDPIPLDMIPEAIKQALLATEDRNFYEHSGVDIWGILRAILRDIKARKFVEGASTITQQLAKTLFLTNRKSLVRKLKEAVLAIQLERRYTKDEILALYLNQVYFGSGAYGVASAARMFFGKDVKDLTLAECALIAGMPKAPSVYSPLVNPQLAVKRRNLVLKQMLLTDSITRKAYEAARSEPLNTAPKARNARKAPYFIEYITNFLEARLGSEALYQRGLTVYTTLSSELQATAEEAVDKGLAALQERMKRQKIHSTDAQAALVALDVATGGILAMVGGSDYYQTPFNRAVDARRQPGSAFKPILYACAVENGFAQNTRILDAPVVYKGGPRGKDWRPENYSRKYEGEITFRKALAESKNIPAVRLIEKLGPATVVDFARQLGIGSRLAPNLSLGLGTSEVSLLDLTSAYAVFPNQGEWIQPFGVTEVLDHNGRVVWRARPEKRAAMSGDGAAVMVDMLEAVVKEGTGRQAKRLGRPLGGKTGTTNRCKDALFMGFSPSVACGVWVGRDHYASLGRYETGAKAALPIWIDVMAKALAERPYAYFPMPDNVIQAYMDPVTGDVSREPETDKVPALFRRWNLGPQMAWK